MSTVALDSILDDDVLNLLALLVIFASVLTFATALAIKTPLTTTETLENILPLAIATEYPSAY